MASSDQLVMSEVKIEIDIAEEPAPPWRSQHHCSDITSDWCENSVSTTITPCETNTWNSSAGTIKSEPDRQTVSGQGIKAEPVDHSVTSDMFHQFQSADNREGKVDIKCESCTCADSSSSPMKSWDVVKSEDAKPKLGNSRTEVNFDWQPEYLRANISSDVIKTEVVTTNISSDVQTEAVTDIMMTVTCDAVRSEAISSRDEEKNRPAGNKQKEGSCIRTTPQPSSANRTSRHKSSNFRSLLPQNRSHVCQRCSAAFVLFSSLKLHMASVHGEKLQAVLPVPSKPDSYDVGNCGNVDIEKFGNLGDRKTVERKKNKADDNETGLEKDRRWHVCDVCSKAFTLAGNLKAHKLIHTSHKQFVCDVCSKAFTQAGHLKTHKMIHTVYRLFVCDVCGKAFTRAGDLKTHKLIHTSHKQFVCDVCSKAFTQSGHLKTHKLIHTGHKQFVCDVCGKAFNRASNFRTHKLTHTSHKQFVCDLCSKAFTEAGSLKRHKLIHTGHKQFVCDVCSEAFTRTGDLKTHKRIHTGERPYKCPHCDDDFNVSSNLQTHIRSVHVGDKPYVCDVCGVAFSQTSHLKTHKRIHTREKPYVCTDCGKGFARSYVLKKHRLTHTGKKPLWAQTVAKVLPPPVN